MTIVAKGPFEVAMTPAQADDPGDDATLGNLILEKQFHGDLEATSKGRMLTAATGIADSAGYVAIERVSGTLHGRRGTFVLQHSALMARGIPLQSITVVPDSGTDELQGLSGTMSITIEAGKHTYDLT